MKIPDYFANVPMKTPRYARPPAGIADEGGGIEAKAMAHFGKELAPFFAKIQQRETVAQLAKAGADWETAHTEFFKGLAKDQDYESYDKKYNVFTKTLKKSLLGKGLTTQARREMQNFITKQTPEMRKEVAIEYMRKQRYHERATMLKAIDDYERVGDAKGAQTAIDAALKAGAINAQEAEQESQAVNRNVDWYKGLEMIDRNPGGFLELFEGDKKTRDVKVIQREVPYRDIEIDEDIGYTFLEHLDPEEKLQLKARAIRQQGVRLARQQAGREQQINAEQGRLMNLARKGELTDDVIRESALDEFGTGSKDTFYKIIDARAKAILADKDEPYLKSDPQVEARILDELRDPESRIIEKDISDLVGKGLSVDDADRLIARLDIFKGDWFRRGDTFLKLNLGWSDTFTKFEHPEGAMAYSVALDELFTAIETENLKGKDVYFRAIDIATPHIIEYHEKSLMTSPEKRQRLLRMLDRMAKPIKEKPATKPAPEKPELPKAEVPERKPVKSARQQAARAARIRKWVVPFNLKFKTKLQPSVLDKMSDDYIGWLETLTPSEREAELKKLLEGKPSEPPRAKPKKTIGSDIDPEGIFQ